MIVTGIAFQVATMVMCGVIVLDFYIRFRKSYVRRPETDNEKTQYETEMEDAKKRLMYTARQIIEITHYIDIQPHTPIW